jgi:hypothetical protein
LNLGVHTHTVNRRFQKALGRVDGHVEELKRRLAAVPREGRFNDVMLTYIDEEPSVVRVTRRGAADDIYEVDVGYDAAIDYPPEDDVLVIQLLEEKLQQVINGDDGFAPRRAELLRIIEDWTTEAIGA